MRERGADIHSIDLATNAMEEFPNVDRSELRVRERGVGFELKSDDGGHDPRS